MGFGYILKVKDLLMNWTWDMRENQEWLQGFGARTTGRK